jgi:spore coat protein CotF
VEPPNVIGNEESMDYSVDTNNQTVDNSQTEESKTNLTVQIPNPFNPQLKKVNSKEFQHVLRSKQDVYNILSREGKNYM